MQLFEKNTGKAFWFQNKRVVVGRAMDSDFRIADKAVSRKHAVLFEEKDQWYLRDERSTNGTWLNGKKVQAEKAYVLHDNDEIVFCQRHCFVFGSAEKLLEEDQTNKLIFLFENAIEMFFKSDFAKEKCIATILFCLSRVPMYLPVEIDGNALFENKNPLEVQNGDKMTLKEDLPIKIKTICVNGEEEMVPIFTSREAVEQGPPVSTLKLWPEAYLPCLIQIGKPVVVNLFSKTKFILLTDWMQVALDEIQKEKK